MIFPIGLVVFGLLSNCRITNFAYGVSVIPPQPVPLPLRVLPPVPQGQSAGLLGFGSMFGILALIILVLLLLTFLRPRNVTTDCPAPYYLYSTVCGQFCYRYESSACQSWSSARATCREEGGDLLVPSECTYQFFRDQAQQNEGSCSNFWIGGSSTTPGSNYVSVRGDPIPNNFIFWSPTQPDPAGGTESCLEMRKNFNNYLMNDFVCSVTQGFICQKNL